MFAVNCCDEEIIPLDNVKLVNPEPSPLKADAEMADDADILPTTSKEAPGVIVPIPILPVPARIDIAVLVALSDAAPLDAFETKKSISETVPK